MKCSRSCSSFQGIGASVAQLGQGGVEFGGLDAIPVLADLLREGLGEGQAGELVGLDQMPEVRRTGLAEPGYAGRIKRQSHARVNGGERL